MSKKVQLIRPPLDRWYTAGQIKEFVSVPTGLLLIASHLSDTLVYDQMGMPSEDTVYRIKEIGADIVGVYDTFPSHLNTLDSLKAAHENGAITAIGGQYVNYLAERILKNNEFIDFAFVGDGEISFPLFVSGEKIENIPNIVYRDKNGTPKRTFQQDAPLTTIFDLEDLVYTPENLEDIVVPISAIRGCTQTVRCLYCTNDHNLRLMQPELVWEQIALLYFKYGMKSILETGDTFMVGNYPSEILKARPDYLKDTVFARVFAMPDQITQENAEVLKKLNLRYLFLGIESINDKALKAAGRNYNRSHVENAISIADKLKLNLHISLMFGLPWETNETAYETYKFAEELIRTHHYIKVVASLAIPLPGSRMFENLSQNPKVREEYSEFGDLLKDDKFRFDELVRLHLKYYGHMDFKFGKHLIKEIGNLMNNPDNFTSYDINK